MNHTAEPWEWEEHCFNSPPWEGKLEREHAAAREIERNQDRIAAGHRLALELECLLMDTKDLPTVSKWWDSGMEALDAWQKLFPYNGPRLGD